jgi:hypothetical protein
MPRLGGYLDHISRPKAGLSKCCQTSDGVELNGGARDTNQDTT